VTTLPEVEKLLNKILRETTRLIVTEGLGKPLMRRAIYSQKVLEITDLLTQAKEDERNRIVDILEQWLKNGTEDLEYIIESLSKEEQQ